MTYMSLWITLWKLGISSDFSLKIERVKFQN